MDRLERFESLNGLLLQALRGDRSELWTALPGIVQSFDPATRTCEIQPAIQAAITLPAYVNGKPLPGKPGEKVWVDMPKLLDCPVFFPSGGGYTLTFPIAKDDECLVIFSSRCIDAWFGSGGHANQQTMLRMHDLSDGFALVGVSSLPKVIPAISTDSTQLRSNTGTTFVELKNGNINIVAPTAVTVTAPTAIVNSTNTTVNATGVAKVVSPSIILQNAGTALKKLVNDTFVALFNNHVHSGVTAGPSSTGTTTTTAGTINTTSVVQAE